MATICCDSRRVQSLHNFAKQCTQLLQAYSWLTESYTLEFFTAKHWSQLPSCWTTVLETEPLEHLGSWLTHVPTSSLKNVFPLSLLAFRASASALSFSRKPVESTRSLLDFLGCSSEIAKDCDSPSDLLSQPEHEKLLALFRKHVKPKKRHEVVRLAGACARTAQACQCNVLVDVGAGVGHLSRMLAYGHGLQVRCLEAEGQFNGTAQKFDAEFENFFHRNPNEITLPRRPEHVTLTLKPNSHPAELINVIGSGGAGRLGLIGLHTCGDLGPTLVRLFAESPEIRMLCSVGCCYMKIEDKASYPLSNFFRNLENHEQSYEAKEIACHALEMYCERLQSRDYDKLKIHCYRAALEVLLQRRGIVRAGLKGVKNGHLMPFEQYAILATGKLDITWPIDELRDPEVEAHLKQWRNVVIFYSLRLTLAPVIETVLLVDRILYLYEQELPSTLTLAGGPEKEIKATVYTNALWENNMANWFRVFLVFDAVVRSLSVSKEHCTLSCQAAV